MVQVSPRLKSIQTLLTTYRTPAKVEPEARPLTIDELLAESERLSAEAAHYQARALWWGRVALVCLGLSALLQTANLIWKLTR